MIEWIAGDQAIGGRRIRVEQGLPGVGPDHAVAAQPVRALEQTHQVFGAAAEQAVDHYRTVVASEHGLKFAHRVAQLRGCVGIAIVQTEQKIRHRALRRCSC